MFDEIAENETGKQRWRPASSIPASPGAGTENETLPRYLRSPEAGSVAPERSAPSATAASTDSADEERCATPEEERRKERFRWRSFSAPDFRPSAGFGKFDAHYWPWLSLMLAVVKMRFRFVEAEDTPPPLMLWVMSLAGMDIRPYFWSEAQKRQYERDYVARVNRQWSLRHTFHSAKPCWPFLAVPLVTPWVVRDVRDAHFDVVVHKMSSPTASRTSSFSAGNPGTAGWRGTGELDENDVREKRDHFSQQVAREERHRIERAIRALNVSSVYFARDRAEIRSPFDDRLRALAEALHARSPGAPPIPITLNGYASSEGRRDHNLRLSLRRAQAVARTLREAGVPQPLLVVALGPRGMAGDINNRKVDIVPSRAFETRYAGNRFLPAGHEFGHALGLPDEYVNRTSGLLGDKQQAFVHLAQQAGVSPPDRWGDLTSSVMSVGVDVLPRHYLTLWEALGHMTQPDIRREQWRIR